MPEAESQQPILRLEAIVKTYGEGPTAFHALRDVDLVVPSGQLLAVMGPSGSGKSTLLNVIGLLDQPTAGKLWVSSEETSTLSETRRTRLRSQFLGFVFQFHHLLPALTAAENVAMPLAVRDGRLTATSLRRAHEALGRLSIAELAQRRPAELSGGQRQRVAVARALVTEPSIVLADEPTGNLDTETGAEVFQELCRLNRELGLTVVIVTHNHDLANRCDRVVVLVDGRISDEAA